MRWTLASKKFASWRADAGISRRVRRLGFCVALPTGQLFVWQARMPRQPIACKAEFATAIPSAPSASAFTKSDSVRRPPVMMSVTPSAPHASSGGPVPSAPGGGDRGGGGCR